MTTLKELTVECLKRLHDKGRKLYYVSIDATANVHEERVEMEYSLYHTSSAGGESLKITSPTPARLLDDLDRALRDDRDVVEGEADIEL